MSASANRKRATKGQKTDRLRSPRGIIDAGVVKGLDKLSYVWPRTKFWKSSLVNARIRAKLVTHFLDERAIARSALVILTLGLGAIAG